MRIISGNFKGRTFFSPKNNNIRPTTDRSREMIFNTLNSIFIKHSVKFSDLVILDCCCGTGALGIESVSRGTKKVFFLDKSKEAIELTKKNFKMITSNINVEAHFLNVDIKKVFEGRDEIDLFFIDPPYNKNIANTCLNILIDSNWLKKSAIGVIEMNKSQEIKVDKNFRILNKKKLSNSIFLFLQKA